MKKALFILITAAVCLPGLSPAAPLQTDHVRSDAQWLVHVNFDAFRNSQIGKLIQNDLQGQFQDKIDALSQLLGSDITKDLSAATFFGPDSEQQNGSALVYGNFDKDKLLSLLVLNPEYAKTTYQDTTIHQWKDEKQQQQQYGAFAADGVIAIAQSQKGVTDALDVLAGQQPSLTGKTDSALYSLIQERRGAIALAAAISLSELAQSEEHAAVLKNSRLFAALADENDGTLKLSVHLEAENTESAMQIEQVARGLLAFAALQTQQQPHLAKLLQAVTLTRGENVIDGAFTYPSADLYEMLKSQIHDNIEIKLN